MRKFIKNTKVSLISGISILAVTACTHSQHTSAYNQTGHGYENAAYGYDYVSGQSNSNTTYKSRYGDELRGSCEVVIETCETVAFVPVYPVYQIITPTFGKVPDVQPVEVPTIPLPEPEPVTIEFYEPEPEAPVYEPPVYEPAPPVYEPVTNYWPEPDTPVETWEPLRK